MVNKFDPVDPKQNFIEMENHILKFWEENEVEKKYLEKNSKSSKNFSFIDGPITANNPMGVHHAWGRTYKDLFQRYKNMQGYKQRFQNGYDGQGLWIEVEVEKEKGFSSKKDIEEYGIDKFVTDCMSRVDNFANRITKQSKRLGYFMDWENSYHTKSDSNNYTIWSFLKKCHDKGWIYKGTDSMPWCPRCGTGLSQHEIVTEGYKEITHPGLFVQFPIKDRINEYLLVWTTTPWTLAANVATAVNPDNTYLKVKNNGVILWVGEKQLNVLIGKYEILNKVKGKDLVGLKYSGPFDDLEAQKETKNNHKILSWEEVSDQEGTGIVHIAPGAGSEDFQLGKKENLDPIAPLDENGFYIEGFGNLSGKHVHNVNDQIFSHLKNNNFFYKIEEYTHRYPICWRCGTELVFRLVDEWFISMDEIRPTMMEVTKKMKWIPNFGKARELDWLKNMQDWMISKKRYYGLALPLFECDCGSFEVIGSKEELKKRSIKGWGKFEGKSPHRPWIDEVEISCKKCGKNIKRIKDVGNAWLDAGIVPFSTLKYDENKDYWDSWFPADWISESFPGQFRNWFYSLIVMSSVLENSFPSKNVFSYALMKDENGEEMHKSKGNAIWFEDAAEKMGVDVMRWIFSRHNPASNLNFGYKIGAQTRRQFFIPIWNIYSFFTTYAIIDNWAPKNSSNINDPTEKNGFNELDRWALSELNILVENVTSYLDKWQINYAIDAIENYCDLLSNWYVRRSRRRFWKSENDSSKLSAYSTLYECLKKLTLLIAPICPFISETIYQNLVFKMNDSTEQSIHLVNWPKTNKKLIDKSLSERTNLAIKICSLGRSARSSANIRVRQPLKEILVEINNKDEASLLPIINDQLLEELNVKKVSLLNSDSESLIEYVIKPNLPKLGPKYGKEITKIKNLLEKKDSNILYSEIEKNGKIKIENFNLNSDELIIETLPRKGLFVASDSNYRVGINTELNKELISEGITREIVHCVQNLRKNSGLEISDRIILWISSDVETINSIENYCDYISLETLSTKINLYEPKDKLNSEKLTVNNSNIYIYLKKFS